MLLYFMGVCGTAMGNAALLADAWPADPAPLQDRVRHFLTLAAQQAAFDIATTIAARVPAPTPATMALISTAVVRRGLSGEAAP